MAAAMLLLLQAALAAVAVAADVSEIGSCVCDTTVATCDLDCCCDPDCDEAARHMFSPGCDCSDVIEGSTLVKPTSGCAVERRGVVKGRKCMPDTELERVNLGERGYEEPARDGLRCVVVLNDPSVGDKHAVLDDNATAIWMNRTRDNVGTTGFAATTAVPSSQPKFTSNYYSVGDAVLAMDPITSRYNFPFTLPAPGWSNECSSTSHLKFWHSVDSKAGTCFRSIGQLDAAACAALGPAAFFGSDKPRILQRPGKNANDLLKATMYVNGEGMDEADLSAPSYSAGSASAYASCTGAVTSAAFKLVFDKAGRVQYVNVTYSTDTLTAFTLGVAGQGKLQQQFTAEWLYQGSAASAINQSIPLSGNPGYLPGLPLLAGKGDTGTVNTTVARAVGGLALVTAPAGVASGAAAACDANLTVPVMFAEDTSVGCSVYLTAAELEAECTSGTLMHSLLGANGGSEINLIGRYGSSDSSSSDDWVQVYGSDITDLSTFAGTGSWDSRSQTCWGLVNEVHWTIMYTQKGKRDAPWFEVVHAFANVSSTTAVTWVAQPGPTQRNGAALYPIRSTVTFVRYEQTPHLSAGIRPLETPFANALLDLWYPFGLPSLSDVPPPWLGPWNSGFLAIIGIFALPLFCVFEPRA